MSGAVTWDGVITWFNDPNNWSSPGGVLALSVEHLLMTLVAVLAAIVVAVPTGLVLARVGFGGAITVVANVSRALPTFALLTLFASSAIGFGNRATVLAVAIFAIPPILTNTYYGIRGVDSAVSDAARGIGMSNARRLAVVEFPLALPMIGAGIRTAAVQVVATVPLAALVGGGGLGTIVVSGFALQRYDQVVAGALLIVVLCLALEGLLALIQRVSTPVPLRSAQPVGAG